MRLPKRLQAIANIIKYQDVVADIGSDHGKLSVYLIKNGLAKTVLATDISVPSLNKTRLLAEEKGLGHNIITLMGDGLKPLKEYGCKVDLGIIAGMGGYEMVKILEADIELISHYILSPQQNTSFLRKKLNEFGYKIIRDFIVLDKGKFYDIIEVIKGFQNLSQDQLEWGLDNIQNPTNDFLMYIDKKIKIMEKALKFASKTQKGVININLDTIKRLREKLGKEGCNEVR